ncbi:MAG: PadR family transcriptional regulator [Marmoricola sp.]
MRTNKFNQMWGPEGRGDFEAIRRQRGEVPRGGRGEGRGRGHGRPGGFGQPFGPFGGGGGFFGPAWGPVFGDPRRGGRGGPRVRRGDVRSAILDVLTSTEEKLNGYQIGQQIADRTDGAWRPSPGSIYPTIAQLEDEGLVVVTHDGGRKTVGLTDAGREYTQENADSLSAVWDVFANDEDGSSDPFKQALVQTVTAIWQISATGTPDQRERARVILDETRRKLYGVLADGPEAD